MKGAFKISVSILLVVVITIGMLLISAGCAPKQAAMPKAIAIATKEAGSTSYAANIPIAAVVSKYAPFKMSVEPAGDIEQVAPLMKKGEMQLVSSSAPEVTANFEGKWWAKEKMPWLRMVLSHYEAPYLFITGTKGPNTFAELGGKKIATYTSTAPVWGLFTDALLKKYGVTSVNKIEVASTTDSMKLVIEGTADVGASSLAPRLADIEKSPAGLKIIPTTKEDIDFINKDAGANICFYTTIPPGYLGLKAFAQPVNYLAIAALWATSKDIPDAVIYEAVKQTYEHYNEFKDAYVKCKEFKLENALRAFPAPYHPGAIKYYKEKGIWTAEHEKLQTELLKRAK